MAETIYDGLELIVRYDGTKTNFEKITDKSAYYGKVVFIAGDSSGKDQAIWIHGENVSGTASGKYLSMTNIAEIENSLSHIKGIKVDGTTYPASGGAILTLVGTTASGDWTTDPLDITVNTDGTVTFDVSAIVGKIDDLSSKVTTQGQSIAGHTTAINTLIGSDSGKSVRAIAKEEASAVKNDLTSDDTDTTQAKTIGGAKKYADSVAASKASAAKDEAIQASKDYVDPLLANKADLENGKIKESQLPDYIFGQMLFGGTITSGGANSMIVSPSTKLLDKVNKPSTTNLTINKTEASTYEGVYFIVTNNLSSIFGFATDTGDWIVSTGADWRKVDNTDAIVKVAGLTPVNGDINASALAEKLAETGDANELALKSEVDEKYSLPDGGIPEENLKESVQVSLGKADSAIQSITTTTPDYTEVIVPEGEDADSKNKVVNVKTTTMQQAMEHDALGTTVNGVVPTQDIYEFLKARLSVKVVSQ